MLSFILTTFCFIINTVFYPSDSLSIPLVATSSFAKPNLIFFTGGNSFMPQQIYTSFLNRLEDYYDVSVINNFNNKESIMEQLLDSDIQSGSNYVALSHSSGATTLLNHCSKFNTHKCILLDPIDNNNLFQKQTPSLDKLDNVLILNAEKTHKWEFTPFPKPPFIPFSPINPDIFENSTSITIKGVGHCDILDEPYSSFMHENFAKGLDNRKKISKYQNCLINLINQYVFNNFQEGAVQHVLESYEFEII